MRRRCRCEPAALSGCIHCRRSVANCRSEWGAGIIGHAIGPVFTGVEWPWGGRRSRNPFPAVSSGARGPSPGGGGGAAGELLSAAPPAIRRKRRSTSSTYRRIRKAAGRTGIEEMAQSRGERSWSRSSFTVRRPQPVAARDQRRTRGRPGCLRASGPGSPGPSPLRTCRTPSSQALRKPSCASRGCRACRCVFRARS